MSNINFDKVYSVKSNAARDMKKALAAGTFPVGTLEVKATDGGFRIVRVTRSTATEQPFTATDLATGNVVDLTQAPMGRSRDAEGEPKAVAKAVAKAAVEALRAEVQAKAEPTASKQDDVLASFHAAVAKVEADRKVAETRFPKAPKAEGQPGVVTLRRTAKEASATVVWQVNMTKAWEFARLVRTNEDSGLEVVYTLPRAWVEIFGNGATVQVFSTNLGIEAFRGEKLDAQDDEVSRQKAARTSKAAPSNRSKAFTQFFNDYRLGA